MVLNHGDHGVRNILLVVAESCIKLLLEALRQFLKDDGAVGNLLSIELDKRKLAFFRAELCLVVHILQADNMTALVLAIISSHNMTNIAWRWLHSTLLTFYST